MRQFGLQPPNEPHRLDSLTQEAERKRCTAQPHRLRGNASGSLFDSTMQDTPCKRPEEKRFAHSATCVKGRSLRLWHAVPGCQVVCSTRTDIAPGISLSCP